jgi:DNA-binding transcriptional LysR family regulator
MFNLRTLDLNLLTVFEAVYELGSVSRGADRLALSPSATSHALSRLREACGEELFVRTRDGLSPTPIARTLYPPIKQALEDLRASLSEATGFDPAHSGRRFRISIPHPWGPFYALAISAAAVTLAPGIALRFDTVTLPVNLEDDMHDGIVDLAVDWLPIERAPYVNRKLFDDRLVLLARGGHPIAKTGVTLENLRNAQFITPHHRRDVDRSPKAVKELRELDWSVAVRVSELLEIPTVVAATDLLGVFAFSMAPLMQRRLGLTVLEMPIELPPVPVYLIWHESRRGDPGHRWLRELVAAEVTRFSVA